MNGHAAADKDEPNCGMHHSLREQMGQLVDRERVLCSENDQLRAQLVEMKEQENKKYDDLMVQYNMKREYEDGTLTNQVTVKTESDDEDVKVEQIKQEIKEEHEEDHDIFIKREYVPAYIKTESDNEDVKDIIKQEIKVEGDEDNHVDDCGFDLRLVKKELVSDDDDNSMQIDEVIPPNLAEPKDILSRDQVNRPVQSVFELSPSANCQMQLTNSSQIEQSVDQQVDKADHEPNEPANHGHNQSPSTSKQSKTRKRRRPGKSLFTENSSFEDSLTSGEVSSPGPMTSTKRIRVSSFDRRTNADQMSTQSKVDLSEGDDPNGIDSTGEGEKGVEHEDEETWLDSETELGDDEDEGGNYKIRTIKLKCTEDGCNAEVSNRVELNDHLRGEHHISPFRCLAVGCGERFEQRGELGPHVRDNHSNISTWPCPHCTKTFKSQNRLYMHLHLYHFEGQFKCDFDSCHYDQVSTLRVEIWSHQRSAHPKQTNSTNFTCQFPNCGKSFNHKGNFEVHQRSHSGVKPFLCDWTGCGKSFSRKHHLNDHQRIHQKVKPYKCTWNKCDYASTNHSDVIRHIRTKHFGLPASLKEQRQLGIEDNRNPRDYLLNTTTPI